MFSFFIDILNGNLEFSFAFNKFKQLKRQRPNIKNNIFFFVRILSILSSLHIELLMIHVWF